ncbi:MAG: hypothetical protein ABL949_08895 [Fimbriimonadaceae bacterium]
MMKRISVILGVVAASIALAAVTVQGAKGGGFVRNAAGAEAYCWMDVKKANNGTEVRVGGPARVRTQRRDGDHVIVTEIGMPKADELIKDGRSVAFAGHALLVISVDGNVRVRREGRLQGLVTDRRSPEHPGDPDTVRLKFTAPTGNPWEFAGLLVRGDIAVYQRTE